MRKKNLGIILIMLILLIVSVCTAKHVHSENNKINNNKVIKLQYSSNIYNVFKIPEATKLIIENTEKQVETQNKIKNQDIELSYTKDDLYWLAKIVNAETFYDTDEGQQAVANVVLNRVNSEEFPDSIYKVVWQKTGKTHQFSPCADGGINREPDERAIENAKIILEGKRVLPEEILFFYKPTKGNKSNWIRSRKIYQKIGVHRFCY